MNMLHIALLLGTILNLVFHTLGLQNSPKMVTSLDVNQNFTSVLTVPLSIDIEKKINILGKESVVRQNVLTKFSR